MNDKIGTKSSNCYFLCRSFLVVFPMEAYQKSQKVNSFLARWALQLLVK